MAAPTFLPANTWVDLYNATSISVGTQLIAHNPFPSVIYLSDSAASPTGMIDSEPSNRTVGVYALNQFEDRNNKAGAAGAWALCLEDTTVQVEEA